MVGFPYSYGDELGPEEATKNLEKLGKVVSIFALSWALQSLASYALDPPKGLPPTDGGQLPKQAPADINKGAPGPANTDLATPGPANGPVFTPILPPENSITCSPLFVGAGVIAVGWTCLAAFVLNDRRLYLACLGLWLYVTNGIHGDPTQPQQ